MTSEPTLGCGREPWPDPTEPDDEWQQHVLVCAECRRDARALDDLLAGVLNLSPSGEVEDRLMEVVERDLTPDTSWVLSVVLGASLALIASVLAASKAAVGETTALTIAISAVTWTAAFSVVIHTLRHAKRGPWAAAPLVVAVFAILTLPAPSEDLLCSACELVGLGLNGARAMFAVVGAVVGLGLTTLVNRFLGGEWRGRQRALIAAVVVLASVGPALLFACAPFSIGSVLGLLGGLFAGAVLSASRALDPSLPFRGAS